VGVGRVESEEKVDPDEGVAALAEEPTAIVKRLVRSLVAGEVAAWQSVLADRLDPQEQASLASGLASGLIKVDPKQPVADLGRREFIERWAVNLLHMPSGEQYALALDFGQDSSGAWALSEVAWPVPLSAKLADADLALTQAQKFLDRLTQLQFAGLSELVLADTVPNEKLAALGIIFDEARFQPAASGHGALKATQMTEDRAWMIAKVYSQTYEVHSEFGLEMKREGSQWLVERINLSRLMREFTGVAAREDAYNPPLVETPSGGESIVLYFGYDDDQLTPRSLKQLSVVAAMLKSSMEKGIQIGGHADALGEDTYNESLSQRRARRVAEALQSLGVRGSQIRLEAFGERQPLRPNLNPDGTDNPTGRERNRRAEIYLDF
jgi:outer membrane protein OmpA-like peptidoglycan-associated protein